MSTMTRNAIYLPEPLDQPPEDDFPEPSAEWLREMADEAAAQNEMFREEDA